MEQLPVTLQFLPPDKQREQDSVLRMMCVEILLLLSTCEYHPSQGKMRRCKLMLQRTLVEKHYGKEAPTLLSENCIKLRRNGM